MLYGLLASLGDPIKTVLGAGLLIGLVLLFLPKQVVWLVLVIGFVFGILSANPLLSKLAWVVSGFSMLLMVPSLQNMMWTSKNKAPLFLKLALLLMLYTVLVSIVQWYSATEFVAGFKRYFQSFGLMMALTLIAFQIKDYKQWFIFLLVVGLLQFPFALYQLLVLVPQRGGLELSSETTDVIAGTFGANLQGGSPNSVMVIYLFMVLSFLVARWRLKLIKNNVFYMLTFICLLPIGMGETKIAVIMLPIVGFILLRKDFVKSPLKFLLSILVIALLTSALAHLYITVIMGSSFGDVINSTLRYNVGDQGYSSGQYLNRMTSVTFWFSQNNWHEPMSFLFGNGLGSSYTSEGSLGGHIGNQYINYGINLTAISTLLWDVGLLGCLLFISVFIAAWCAAGNLYNSVSEESVKADALAIQASISLFFLSMFYSDSIVNLISMELIYAIVLGYLGYLLNRNDLIGNSINTRRARKKS